jgi:hypothetical protein
LKAVCLQRKLRGVKGEMNEAFSVECCLLGTINPWILRVYKEII